jgi:hypothetical protein
MSILYGNPLALKSATGLNRELTGGEAFTLVTWKQQPDEHWFGANIPGDLQSVEVLETISNGADVGINYQRYDGKALVLNSDILNKGGKDKIYAGSAAIDYALIRKRKISNIVKQPT